MHTHTHTHASHPHTLIMYNMLYCVCVCVCWVWLKKLAKLHRNHYAVNDKCHALLMTKGCRQSTPEEAPFRSTFAPSIERHSHLRESSFHRPQEIGKQTNKHKAINTIQHNLPNTLHV